MKKITLCLLILFGYSVRAQLTVSNVETPAQLVQNVLIGQGVTPTNITYNGTPANTIRPEVGHFITNFNPTNLGISEGMIMSTGRANAAPGPNTAGNTTTTIAGGDQGDSDLDILTTNSVENVTIIEFDFVATGLELNFDFVFASEEYPEWVYNGFNDVFGFFLSGPGITGPFSNNAKNLAIVPNTTIPISINTINNNTNNTGGAGAQNPLLYNNNTNIGQNPYTGTGPTVMFDGFTDVLRATSPLICGETYHIKLAISNAGDTAYDSAVFLKNFRIAPMELVDNLNLAENVDVCYGETVTIDSGITAGSNVFVWSINTTYDPANPGAYDPTAFTVIPNESGPTLGTTQNGVYSLTVYTDYGCQIAYDEIKIHYRPEIPINAPDPINICTLDPFPLSVNVDQTTYMMTPVNPAEYVVSYYNSSYQDARDGVPTGIIPNANLAGYPINTATTTIWVRIEEVFGSGCVLVKPFTINVSPEPSGNFSYPGTPYCAALGGQPITTNVTPGGTYSATPSGLDIDPITGDIDPSASTPGNYNVSYFLPASGTCPDFTPPSVPVSITATPAAPTAPSPLTYCQDEVAPALTAVGTNLMWYDVPTNGTGSATAPIPDTSLPGSKTYYVSQTNGCEGPRQAIVVNVNPSPALPTFNTVPPYCQNASATALSATGTSLLWYTDLTTGVGNPVAPVPSTATAGIVNYYVSQTVAGCESQRALIAVETIALPATPTVVSPVGYCQNEAPAALSATGTNLLWYAAATGGVGNAVTPSVNTAAVANTTYYVSQTVNGCEGPRSAITVNVTAIPAAPGVLSPLTYCQDEVAPALSALGSNLLWYTDPTTGTGSATAPIPSTATAGNITYYVSQSTGCESPRSAITINVTATPSTPVTAPIVYCQNAPTTALTAVGSNLLWYADATTGTGSTTAPVPSSAIAGNTTYYVTQTVNGCESLRESLAVTVTALPSAPTVTPMVGHCQGVSAPALTATGSNLLWYAAASGGIGNASAPFPSTAAVGNTNYYVSQTVDGCEGPRAVINVEIYPIPNAPTVNVTQPTCAVNTGTIAVTAPVGINLEYSINNGVNYQPGTSFNNVAAGVTYDVMVRNSLTGCVSTVTQAIVNPALVIPAAPTASTTVQPNCITTTGTIEVSAPIGANLEYTIDGGVTYQSATTFNGLTANAAYTIAVRDSSTGCTSASSVVNVDPIPANPAAPTGTITQPTCAVPTGAISLLAPLGANLEYSINGGATYQSGTGFGPLTANATYNIIVRNTVTGCISAPTAFVINVAPTYPATPVATASDVCFGEQITLSTPAVSGASYSWTGPNGFISSDQNPVINNADISMSGTYSVVISTTADCPSAPGSVNVAVNPLPAPVLDQNGYICFNSITNTGDSYQLNAGLDNATYDFQWFVNNNGSFEAIPTETQNTYTVSTPGTYGVQATNTTTGCVSAMVTAPVGLSSPPLRVTAVSSEYFADIQAITIHVEPAGEYLYQLDNGAFQSSNVFSNVLPGHHDIIVKNQCGELMGTAYLMDYPKFFTPNGDGHNDTWNIFALSGQANAKIYIFDRYGKLIKQISPSGKGWDGTYNTQLLPGTDYWFTVEYEENAVRKEFKSHFALKR